MFERFGKHEFLKLDWNLIKIHSEPSLGDMNEMRRVFARAEMKDAVDVIGGEDDS